MKIKADESSIREYAKHLIRWTDWRPEIGALYCELFGRTVPFASDGCDFSTEDRLALLVNLCTTPLSNAGRSSHAVRDRLEQINLVLGNHGVQAVVLGEYGQDVSGEREFEIVHDIQWSKPPRETEVPQPLTTEAAGFARGAAQPPSAATVMWYNGAFYIGAWDGVIESFPQPRG